VEVSDHLPVEPKGWEMAQPGQTRLEIVFRHVEDEELEDVL
jgi:hypothetical protein